MENSNYNTFGVRHLSPGASFHLLKFLNKKKPKCLLIEGPSDATFLIKNLGDKKLKPPVAMLAYTSTLPIETVLYPFAEYSPELQAILWGIKHNIEIRFIDLPTNIMLSLQQQKKQEKTEQAKSYYAFHNEVYGKISQQANETQYEDYWERNFEHNLNPDTYQNTIALQSTSVRNLVETAESEAVPYDYAYNLLREAYMRRQIEQAITDGFDTKDIAIVVGAYHLAGITPQLSAMTDDELNGLPKTNAQLTLMPYSYLRLSSRTGYGAGNKAPFYFDLMWRSIKKKKLAELPAIYITKVAKILRKNGFNASSASIIEAVRLANALTAMRSGNQAVLSDLHDAIITCLGGGYVSPVAEAINRIDIGTAIGSLPEGVSQTPVQEDMNQELKRLKLTKYKSSIAQDLALDLRENLKVKSREAAFIDLNRSAFLHRLQVLGIQFAKKQNVYQDGASWSEKWILQWSPEVEIEIVEANLKGETLKIATAYELRERLNNCTNVGQAAEIIRQSCECNLTSIFDNALSTLQALLIDANNFKQTVEATAQLSTLIAYGDLRQFKIENLIPVLKQLFLRSALILVDAANCDDKAANNISNAISVLENISQQQYELVDTETWQTELSNLAWRDDLNTKLSGIAFSILLEHNLATEEDCAKEVSKRLSAGVPADLGASWFEGLAGRNRYALLSRISLWQELSQYVDQLDEAEFKRSLVFLRRAFGAFQPHQKNSIAELLGDLWGTGAEATAEFLQDELTEEETDTLEDLNDFDFDF